MQITEYLFLKCNSFSGIQYLMLSPFLTITYLDDLKHFHACDLSIPIQIIHIEGPVEFLLEAAPGGDGQCTDELPEVDGPVTILVKCPKGVLRKLRGITIWEKLESERWQEECDRCITYILHYLMERHCFVILWPCMIHCFWSWIQKVRVFRPLLDLFWKFFCNLSFMGWLDYSCKAIMTCYVSCVMPNAYFRAQSTLSIMFIFLISSQFCITHMFF